MLGVAAGFAVRSAVQSLLPCWYHVDATCNMQLPQPPTSASSEAGGFDSQVLLLYIPKGRALSVDWPNMCYM